MAAVIPALGTILEFKATSGGTYAAVANILSVSFPSASVEAVETSNLGTAVKTYRPGQVDPGDVALELQFDPGDTQHAALRAYVAGGTTPVVAYWRIVAPTTPAKGEEFQGFLTELSPAAEDANGNLEASATIKVSGAITAYTAGGGGGS
jgi:hypothetical protein